MKVELDIPTKEYALLVAYYLFDKASDLEIIATRWGANDGEDGDAVDVSLRAEAAMLTAVAKSISRQIKSWPAS